MKDGRWKCWSACAAGGDAIDLLVWLRGVTKAKAIEELAAIAGLDRADDRAAIPASGQDRLIGWCRRRGWGPWVVSELGLSLVEDRYGRPRIRFPFRLDGSVPYHQDRALDEGAKTKWLSPTGSQPIAYEADRLRLAHDRGHVFILEGVTDVAALVDVYTCPAAVGVPGVNAWRSNWASSFEGLGVYVIGDNDAAGERFRARLTADLEHVARAVWNLYVPEPFGDVADWSRGLDPEKFDSQLMAAAEAASPGRVRMAG